MFFSVDIKPFPGTDLVKDVEFLERWEIPFKTVHGIWASPLCTSYSIAGIRHHRRGQRPVSEIAVKSDRLVKKTLEIFKWFPGVPYFMENPVGMLRKMSFMANVHKETVWYCQYGDFRAKPTDIFTNDSMTLFNPNGWIPRPKCFNNNKKCHHEPSPRGTEAGTQKQRSNYLRSIVPEELCLEIIKHLERKFKTQNQ